MNQTEWDGSIPEAQLNAGVENCIKMAEMFTTDLWNNGVAKHWVQMEINPNLNLIKLDVGLKHYDGTEETPFATYKFRDDGTYQLYVHP